MCTIPTNANKIFIFLQRIKEKKTYSEEVIDDDEIEGKRMYSVDEKLRSTKYNKDYVQILKGEG
jgi:hypothetical protein